MARDLREAYAAAAGLVDSGWPVIELAPRITIEGANPGLVRIDAPRPDELRRLAAHVEAAVLRLGAGAVSPPNTPLSPVEVAVLKMLVGKRLMTADIKAELEVLNPTLQRDAKTIRAVLCSLESAGLAARPNGERGGRTATAAGAALLAALRA
jgi:hypothetical protein